jgi:hypothetical protein
MFLFPSVKKNKSREAKNLILYESPNFNDCFLQEDGIARNIQSLTASTPKPNFLVGNHTK